MAVETAAHRSKSASAPLGDDALAPPVSSATWDAALVQTHLADFLTSPVISTSATTAGAATPATTSRSTLVDSDPAAITSGLSQLNKYLSRAWYRAGMPAQVHDDSTQAVYTTLLQNLGRQCFDTLVADVGQWGVKDVFSRETSEGLDFFRAVDMVKKRAQRETNPPVSRVGRCTQRRRGNKRPAPRTATHSRK